ncbi:Retrovirus-related Pol polyprotein from transposon 297 [Anthophora retusa]
MKPQNDVASKSDTKIPDCTTKMLQSNNEIENKKVKNILRDHNTNTKIEINFNEHIKPQDFNIMVTNLNLEQKSKINELIEEYKHIFAKDKYDIETIKNYEARIDLIINKYCCKRPYRCTIEDKKEIESQVSKLLEKKLIEESYSPFAAPVTLAFKKEENKKSRLCIDSRDLNKIVVPQSQPFPMIEDLTVQTRGCRYFTTLDINSAFWSIPLRIEDRRKTAFMTQEGHYQWTCLPFGLKTAPAIFQRILSSIIRKYKLNGFAVNYIDDILIFSKSFDEHISDLKQLLDAIAREGFR